MIDKAPLLAVVTSLGLAAFALLRPPRHLRQIMFAAGMVAFAVESVLIDRLLSQSATPDDQAFWMLAFQCAVGALLLTPQAVMSWSTPAWVDLAFFAALGLLSLVGHGLTIAASGPSSSNFWSFSTSSPAWTRTRVTVPACGAATGARPPARRRKPCPSTVVATVPNSPQARAVSSNMTAVVFTV